MTWKKIVLSAEKQQLKLDETLKMNFQSALSQNKWPADAAMFESVDASGLKTLYYSPKAVEILSALTKANNPVDCDIPQKKTVKLLAAGDDKAAWKLFN